jgi:hypothetical protein
METDSMKNIGELAPKDMSKKFPWRKREKRGFYKNTIANVLKIFTVLKEAYYDGDGFLSVSEIARRAGLHKWTVSRTIDEWMPFLVEQISPEELEQIGMKIKFVKVLNPKLKDEDIKKIIRMKT